jgi:hypothetical protein
LAPTSSEATTRETRYLLNQLISGVVAPGRTYWTGKQRRVFVGASALAGLLAGVQSIGVYPTEVKPPTPLLIEDSRNRLIGGAPSVLESTRFGVGALIGVSVVVGAARVPPTLPVRAIVEVHSSLLVVSAGSRKA